MPDWDADSPELRANLTKVINEIARSPSLREKPTLESARRWQRDIMNGLVVPDSRYVGAFRGEPGLETVQVRILSNYGTPAVEVSEELTRFETKLQGLVVELDSLIPVGQEPDVDQLAAVIDLCAWVHAEWVRIHPFANGNGRTARLWANSVAMRYGLPPFIRLRPRPNAGYAEAGAMAMQGDWKPTATVFRQLLNDFLDEV
jgi:hypothetical protein